CTRRWDICPSTSLTAWGQESDASVQTKNTSLPSDSAPDIEISDLDVDENDPAFAEFREIMEKFKVSSVCSYFVYYRRKEANQLIQELPGSGIEDKGELMMHDDDGIPDEEEEERE